MPVLLDYASQNITEVAGTTTSGSVSNAHPVSPMAQAVTVTLFAFVASSVDTTAATFTATFGGVAMTMKGTPVRWGSNQNALMVFVLAGPPTSPTPTWEFSVSGMTANSNGFWLLGCCESNSGVLTVGTPVFVSGDTAGASTANTVTVDSSGAAAVPAAKIVTAHAVSDPYLFSGYTLNTRAAIDGTYAYIAYLLSFFGYNFLPYTATAQGGELLVGDAPGAPTVVGTATQPDTALYGAIGLPLIAAPVAANGALQLSASAAASGSLTRVTAPSPWRTWTIGGTNP
ncbi:MAG: hypothetical protein RBS21_00390 [Corynebacterium sp.]|jgi:hypothetical protein|nr:hypothetical protein [Corynebacterium sp.]